VLAAQELMAEFRKVHQFNAPEESLALARNALVQKTAPRAQSEKLLFDEGDDDIDSHHFVLSRLPALVKPVALWHDAHREAALDFLWQLSEKEPNGTFDPGTNHPWSTIAEVVQFTPQKSVHVTAAALAWIARLVRRPSVRARIESNRHFLGTLLGPCFARLVEFSEWQGRTIRRWRVPVNMETTAPIRAHAGEILAELIEQDSWRLALDAVRALGTAVLRISVSEADSVRDVEAFRTLWRPEREAALALLFRALARHTHPMVRFTVRQMLQPAAVHEDDEEFRGKVREALATVPEDLELRLLIIINSDGCLEFGEELGTTHAGANQTTEERWQRYIGDVVDEFLLAHADSGAAADHLERVATMSLEAGHTPHFGELLPMLARRNPDRAMALVRTFLDPARTLRITGLWHQLLFGLSDRRNAVWPLLQQAASDPRAEIRRGVVDFLAHRDPKEMVLTVDEQHLLEQMATQASADEVMLFVRLVHRVGESCAEWGFRLLERFRLSEVPPHLNGEVLAALNPYKVRQAVPPESTVRHILTALIPAPEIEVDHHCGGFDRARTLYPRAVYDFVLQRIAHHERLGPTTHYQAVPRGHFGRLQIPGLEHAPEFPAICDFLWKKASHPPQDHTRRDWRELFQGIALDQTPFWLPGLIGEVNAAPSLDALRDRMELVHFGGSLVIFHFPELTAVALQRAEDLEGVQGREKIQTSLHHITGPSVRGYTNGELNKDGDYVEAAAIKAASAHSTDPILGPFFRWIADVEKHEREEQRRRNAAEMAALDE
ncbi:MAG: hypothetical protein J0L84_01615, partial [Verrucomicrobia bacterium]|nr:hypothetical protein [Verrucomicrobiota bacterium]